MNAFPKVGSPVCRSLSLGTVLLSSCLVSLAHAEVSITGTPDALRIEAAGVTLEEVLSDLHDKFGVSYNSLAVLNDKSITGTFDGSLMHVVGKLLKDYDHALKLENGRLFLVLTNQQKATVKPESLGSAASSALPTAVTTANVSSAAGEPSSTETTTNSIQKGAPPTGSSSSVPPRTQSPFAITSFLEIQSGPFVNRGAAASAPVPASVNSSTSQTDMTSAMQRANVTLQSLAASLARLPH